MVEKLIRETHRRLMRRFKVNVRAFRCAMNLTVEDAAARAHVPLRSWQNIEAGEVNATLSKITQIANALGVDPQHLFLPRSSRERKNLLREARLHAAKTRKR